MEIADYNYPKHFLLTMVLRLDLKFSGFPSKLYKTDCDGLEKNFKKTAANFH